MAFYSISYFKLRGGSDPVKFEKFMDEAKAFFLELPGCIDLKILKCFRSSRPEEEWDYGAIEVYESLEAHHKSWGPDGDVKVPPLLMEKYQNFIEKRLWVEVQPLGD